VPDSGAITIDVASYDIFSLTAKATGASARFMTYAGSPVDGQELKIYAHQDVSASMRFLQWSGCWTGGTGGAMGGPILPLSIPTGGALLLSFVYITGGSLNKWVLSHKTVHLW
jgi:hypothetical protein